MAQKKSPQAKKPPQDEDDQEGQEGSEGQEEDTDDAEDAAKENQRINAIVTSRVKREMKGVLATLATIQESIKGLAAPKTEETDDEESTGAEKPAQEDPKLARKMSKLEKELAEEKAARKKAEEEKAQELERGKRNEMRSSFASALTELGLTDPKLLRAALNVLEEDGVMIRDEDNKIKFKGQDKYGIETNFDPKAGLKSWIATEGKSFVPAVDAGGSGTGGARGTGNGTQSFTSKEFGKLTAQQKASINLERACSGLPPIPTEEG